jgi:hypothetical protein
MGAPDKYQLTVDLDGRRYLWTGAAWCDAKTFQIPGTALEPKLAQLGRAKLEADGRPAELLAPKPAPAPKAARSAPKRRAAPADAPGVEITPEYQQVLSLLAAGAPLVLATGVAGTGKSTLISVVRERAGKRIVVVAPTGVAALNAEGATIHSFFRFPPRIVDPGEIEEVADRTLFEKLDLLIVDEVSMVRADVLDGIDRSLRVNRRAPALPFGGVQVLLVGDLFQLPPVVQREMEGVFRGGRYATPHFFGAHCLQGLDVATVELTKVFRQQDDGFVALLNGVRTAEHPERVVASFNAACVRQPWADGNYLTLTSTNAIADAENAARLAALPGPVHVFVGRVEGRMERQSEKLPAPLELLLKEGARVMFTRNDEERRWVNGTFGIVRRLDKDTAVVEITSDPSGKTHAVGPATWESHRYRYDRALDRIEAEAIGSYTQLPLMPAWAVTIHKSQGKTLDRVFIDLGRGAFAPGQVYVALSRCRRLEDVALARPLRPADLRVDPQIVAFLGGGGSGAPGARFRAR